MNNQAIYSPFCNSPHTVINTIQKMFNSKPPTCARFYCFWKKSNFPFSFYLYKIKINSIDAYTSLYTHASEYFFIWSNVFVSLPFCWLISYHSYRGGLFILSNSRKDLITYGPISQASHGVSDLETAPNLFTDKHRAIWGDIW